MYTLRSILTQLTLLLAATFSYGQVVDGTVVDGYGNPILQVDILNQTNGSHAHSDERGYFRLDKAAVGDTLLFVHLGYESKSIIVSSTDKSLFITLKPSMINLDEVVIMPSENDLSIISDIDIQTSPVNSSQDILRKVPGLIIGQHAGGGKAEQIFLRGFDIDHGTDINIAVDGMPVNMVSHAHGQGYADLHFVIPETVENIDFGKGPYYADQGNFNTAGYVTFHTKEKLNNNLVGLELGQFNSRRLLGMVNVLNKNDHNAYIASEFLMSDGPFESSQNFNRTNLYARYTGKVTKQDKLSVIASHFTSEWDASGQIPQRMVDNGSITRFGAIDDTEGGNTSRSNIAIHHERALSSSESIESKMFMSRYDFNLFSNFTFFLDDPVNGDQIEQKEDRTIFGFNSEYTKSFSTESTTNKLLAGINLRNDISKDNKLAHTLNRKTTLDNVRFGNINETNMSAYVGLTTAFNRWVINPSVRVDHFDFQYTDQLSTLYSNKSTEKSIVSPKINVMYNMTDNVQLYAKAGKGFHSNDTRVVVASLEENTLPAAYGYDLGAIWKPTQNMLLNIAYWNLYLEQEFVYVGDAGIVEPSGETKRNGVELSFRYQPTSWLYYNLDANYTHARGITDDGDELIPLAPDFTLMTGLNLIHPSGLQGGISVRHIDDRPANEDNSIVAVGYTVTDFNIGYKWNRARIGLNVQNLFDVEWNETQFATESRLLNEAESVEEIHFTPGTPFNARVSLQYEF